jgi:hypothetical protein
VRCWWGGCASTPEVVPNSPEAKAAIEERIRWRVGKPNAQSFPTYFKGELTKAQIDELKKALPKCKIYSNPKK